MLPDYKDNIKFIDNTPNYVRMSTHFFQKL